MTTFADNGTHSVTHSNDVWATLKAQEADKVGKPHRDMADIREAFDSLEKNEARLFQRYEEARAGLESVGVVAQLKFSARREAAYREWMRGESAEPLPRVFTEVPDPPIGPEHE